MGGETTLVTAFGLTAALVCSCTPIGDLAGGDHSSDPTGDGSASSFSGEAGAVLEAGAVDAAPPPCSCAPSAPVGWTGPFVLYDGPPKSAPACPAGTSTVFSGTADMGAALPAVCGACQCASPKNATCTAGKVTATIDGASDGPCKSMCAESLTGGCLTCPGNRPFYSVNLDVTADTSLVDAGSCTPSPSKPTTTPAVTWARAAVGCASKATAQCGDKMACVPVLPPPFQAHACIERQGTVACPTSVYTQALNYFTNVDDTRACTPCACGAPSGVSCALRGNVGAGNACTNAPSTTIAVKTGCFDFNGAAYYGFEVVGVGTGGTCTASGGEPTGSAAPSGPVTVCCAP